MHSFWNIRRDLYRDKTEPTTLHLYQFGAVALQENYFVISHATPLAGALGVRMVPIELQFPLSQFRHSK